MLLLIAAVLAHVPHDTVLAVAAPRALDATHPWWMVGNPQGDTMLLRSDDRGLTWRFVGGAPLADALLDAAMLDDGTVVLLGPTRHWWTTDGSTWESMANPGAVERAWGGASLLLGGPDGLWEGAIGALSLVSDRPVRRLGAGPVAIVEGGDLLVGTDGWAAVSGPSVSALSSAQGSALYVGDEAGAVWRRDGEAWTACGAVPPGSHPAIVNIAVDDSVVVVATAEHAGWTSTDGCRAWQDLGPTSDALYGVAGGAAAAADGWPVLASAGATRIVGGWAGFFVSLDGGDNWADTPIVGADYIRGMDFSSNFVDDGLLFVGGYAAGILRTFDGGESFDAPDHGMPSENVQRLRSAPDDADVVVAVSGHHGWRSRDRGVSWEAFGDDAAEVEVWTAEEVWIFGAVGIYATDNGGTSWETLLEAHGVGAAEVAGTRCVTTSTPVQVVCLRDGEWEVRYEGGGVNVSAPVAWPRSRPTRLLFGDDDGVHVTDDLGETWATTWSGEDPVLNLARADDDTLVLATRSGLVGVSEDGGDTWSMSPVRLSDSPHSLLTRPGFARYPDILVGSHDGVWLVRPGEPPVRFAAYQRIDAASTYWERSGLPAATRDGDASMDTLQPLVPGARMSTWVRGGRIRVLGSSTGLGRADVLVDGVTVVTVGDTASAPGGLLGELSGLPDVWHRLAIVGVAEGVAIDAVEVFGEGAILEGEEDDTAGTDDTAAETGHESGGADDTATRPNETGARPDDTGSSGEGCESGCGGGGGGALLLNGLVGLRGTRRHRPTAGPPPRRPRRPR